MSDEGETLEADRREIDDLRAYIEGSLRAHLERCELADGQLVDADAVREALVDWYRREIVPGLLEQITVRSSIGIDGGLVMDISGPRSVLAALFGDQGLEILAASAVVKP